MSRGILQSALQNPSLHLELEYCEPADTGSGNRASWGLAETEDLDIHDSAVWLEFCRSILQTESVGTL